ncbi:unnamed protein product [Phytophthora fragariaefolia]|uniref:Unnamed protein product n=1 Tax=Phytophthora fragariaefolia TaxID=1490495 RepID=A0A9W7DAY2_9STRA|nr:unnamed protein product [Phytophthora fragariaefolia]
MDLWVGDLVGQHAILGMNFMVPTGVRIDTANGTACLPDEVRIQLIGRRPLYGAKMHPIGVASPLKIDPGQAQDVPLRPDRAAPLLGVTRGKSWVVILVKGKIGRKSYLRVANVGERRMTLDAHTPIGWWTPTDAVPRAFGFVQPDSRRYQEWQNVKILGRREERHNHPRDPRRGEAPVIAAVATVQNKEPELRPKIEECVEDGSKTRVLGAETGTRTENEEDVVVIHKGTDLFAEELESEMAVLPDLSLTAEVKIGDLKVRQPTGNEPQVVAREGERLRQIIWKRRRWLIGKGNALPAAAVEVVCDIDVGDARPVAQRVRKIPPQFREKVADLIKGLLSAGMIQHSTSPWASPIVVIVKKNGVDIRLCIKYSLVNGLTQLMVYPMPVVNDLLEDIDKYLWYCSLGMASGFWVVPMTHRARLISAFITPLGLFEWLRMPFGLCNAPQIYQRLIDNALYGFLRPSPDNATRDVFEEGTPVRPGVHSTLGHRSYIDDILIGGTSWDDLCEKVERLLDACEQWHLSISVEKSEWGMTQVDYLGHKVSKRGLRAYSKNLASLTALEFPRTLKGLQSFLGSLNYYHRFIPDFAVHAICAFEALKVKLAETPMLKHFDPQREPILIVYASGWAVAAVLAQVHDDVCMPVKFTSRTLKPNELNYSMVEKEILALLRALNDGFTMLAGRKIPVLTRHTTLAWMFRSKRLQGRLSQWAAVLSPWKMEICRSARGEEEILGTLAASITPRERVYAVLEGIAPRERPSRTIIAQAASGHAPDLTVNEAEYKGLLLGCSLLGELDVTRLIICGDSNLVIRQMRGAMDCKSPGLKLLQQLAKDELGRWPRHELFHVRRDLNASADMLAGQALQRQAGRVTTDPEEIQGLVTLNRLKGITLPPQTQVPEALEELAVQRLRLDRVRVAQDEELWIANLERYLRGDLGSLSRREAKDCRKIAPQFEEGESGLLYYHTKGDEAAEDRDMILKLVVPETLRDDILHHYHASLEGGHQGIGRTYQRVRRHFHCPGNFKSAQRYVGVCTDCETGKGRPTIIGASPGNIVATYPFQVVAMDPISSLPVSYKGDTELLVWVDLFTGYIITRANSSRNAQTVAEAYEEAVFRRFGASEAIRHDRDPGFMADFFRAFSKMMGQRQRATLTYRPQANGTAERMVQTVVRAVKMYITDIDQRDWDEYAERLTFALNTSYDRTRDETPFYLVHGWDARSTLEATLSVGNTSHRDAEARRWRMRIQRHYKMARTQAHELVQEAVAERARRQNEDASQLQIETGSQVWLYLDRVKPGYPRKLAHMWHGPFRVAERVNDFAVRMETAGTPYQLFPIVQVSKLKAVREFPSRPMVQLTTLADECFDFDEEILPDDSWSPYELEDDVFEVEEILDTRESRATRYGRTRREFKVRWKGYPDHTCVDEADLNCGGMLYDFLRRRMHGAKNGRPEWTRGEAADDDELDDELDEDDSSLSPPLEIAPSPRDTPPPPA